MASNRNGLRNTFDDAWLLGGARIGGGQGMAILIENRGRVKA
jgi:hypothetical protein